MKNVCTLLLTPGNKVEEAELNCLELRPVTYDCSTASPGLHQVSAPAPHVPAQFDKGCLFQGECIFGRDRASLEPAIYPNAARVNLVGMYGAGKSEAVWSSHWHTGTSQCMPQPTPGSDSSPSCFRATYFWEKGTISRREKSAHLEVKEPP